MTHVDTRHKDLILEAQGKKEESEFYVPSVEVIAEQLPSWSLKYKHMWGTAAETKWLVLIVISSLEMLADQT